MRLRQPIWTRFLPTRTVLTLATLGPVGRLPAPGTWGSVAGLLYFIVVFCNWDGPALFVWTIVLSLFGGYFAVAICGEAEFRLARKDPGEVILDEFVAVPLVFLGWTQIADLAPANWGHLRPFAATVAGVALFRLFDILKPFGIRKLQDLPGGWGIVIDDTVAALAACLVLHIVRLIKPW